MTPPDAARPALSEERGDWLTVWMRSGRIMEARSTRLPQEDVIKAGREIHEIAAARLTITGAAQPLAPAPKLLSDKIEEFIDWLEEKTDFADWSPNVKREVHRKLIEVLTQK